MAPPHKSSSLDPGNSHLIELGHGSWVPLGATPLKGTDPYLKGVNAHSAFGGCFLMAKLLSEILTELTSIFPASALILTLKDLIISSVFCFIAFRRISKVEAAGAGCGNALVGGCALSWVAEEVSISTVSRSTVLNLNLT